MTDQTLRALIARVRETFDPGGTLPDDCAEWAREHDAAIAALAAGLDAAPPLADLRTLLEDMRHTAEQWQADPTVADDQTIAARAWADGLDAALAHPPQGEMKGEKP